MDSTKVFEQTTQLNRNQTTADKQFCLRMVEVSIRDRLNSGKIIISVAIII
jgi:hypothetical protein